MVAGAPLAALVGDWILREPGWLLLPALWLLVEVLKRSSRGTRTGTPVGLLGVTQRGGAPLPTSLRARTRFIPPALFALALVAGGIALARPAEREVLPQERRGIDLLLCLDISSSMLQTDMDGRRTRLAVTREAAIQFVAGRPSDRIGLLTFARYPDLRCPPTLDHETLIAMLEGLEVVAQDGPEDATGLGAAVARGVEILRPSTSPSKVLVLLTDGEETVAASGGPDAIAPIHAAQLCAQLGIRVQAVLAGTERRDPRGRVQPVDPRAMQDLARLSGGAFHRARTAADIRRTYDTIGRLERAAFEKPKTRLRDRHAPFLLVALILGLAAFVARSTWWRVTR